MPKYLATAFPKICMSAISSMALCNFHYLYEIKRISIMVSEMTFENVDRHTDKGQTNDVCDLLTFKPSHGVQHRMISVINFFVFLRLLFFALLLLYVT